MYYIYEMQIPEEDLQLLKFVAEKERMSLNDFFVRGFAYIAGHPDEVRAWKEQYDQLPEEQKRQLERIKISRIYPVEDGETEEEARRRQLQKEREAFPFLDSPATLPVITQQEFCDHIDDEDFFLAYGNPVVIQADSGSRLMAVAFPLYERYMQICGRGDEIDEVKRECAEADKAGFRSEDEIAAWITEGRRNTIHYKGYTGSVEFSDADGVFYGKVQDVRSLVSYEGRTCQELVDDFHKVVDDYLMLCEAEGSEPENRSDAE